MFLKCRVCYDEIEASEEELNEMVKGLPPNIEAVCNNCGIGLLELQ